MKIGLAQLNSRADREANLVAAGVALERLAAEGVDLALLPEMFNHLAHDADNAAAAEPIPGPSTAWASEAARRLGMYVHCGSIMERRGEDVFNTAVVYDREGSEVARYSKIHLFDVRLPDGTAYVESAAVTPGDRVVTFSCHGLTFGMAICYDLRFPELFRALADEGADVFVTPAAFTVATGISHWEPLVRARAIENGCYLAACGQWGPHGRGRACYGHSLVVDPWGTVIAQCSEGVGTCTAGLDEDAVRATRERMPVLRHRRRDLFG